MSIGRSFWRRPLISRCNKSAFEMGFPGRPLYPLTVHAVARVIGVTWRNFMRSSAKRVSIKTNPFAPESAKADV